MTAATKEISPRLEDALAYLPRKAAVEYDRGQIIYNEHHPSHELSLVICGRIKVTTVTDGTPTVIGIFSADEFFGFPSLLGDYTKASEEAIALERTQLMPWSRAEIEAAIECQPRLGVALMQIAAQLCLDFEERLQGWPCLRRQNAWLSVSSVLLMTLRNPMERLAFLRSRINCCQKTSAHRARLSPHT
jgi:CRP-like cAMP-binding protein